MREAFREGFRPGDPEWKRFFRQFFDGDNPNGENRRSNVLSLRVDEAQRVARAERIRDAVRANDITRWITTQLQDLRELIA